MDETAIYCRRIRKILKTRPEGFDAELRRRWAGESGPALGEDRTWSAVLAWAYRETPEELREPWARALITVFDDFTTGELLDLGTARRVELLGALDLAPAMVWPPRLGGRLQAHLAGWLELALQPDFPPSRDLWEEDQIYGQPEIDLVTALLRLASRQLAWRDVAALHWRRALDDETGLAPTVVAWRLWEIARWAIAADRMGWLAERLVTFERALEDSGYAPGNLTRLFFLTEADGGVEPAKELLVAFVSGLDRVVPINYEVRKAWADKIDYFGVDSPEEAGRRLRSMRVDKAVPLPEEEAEKLRSTMRGFYAGKASLADKLDMRLVETG